jgi:hypothetical protein
MGNPVRCPRIAALATVAVVVVTAVFAGTLAGTLSVAGPAQAVGKPADGEPADGEPADGEPDREPADRGSANGVVVIGVPGLRWGDVKPRRTPVLWRLAREGAIANIAVRGVGPYSCPAEGWLTISAGSRARPLGGGCARPPKPRRDGAGAVVPDFADLRERNAAGRYAAQVGLLGEAVHREGACTTAVGRGGVLALADSAGRVDYYRPSVAKTADEGWRRCPVTAVDIDDIAGPGRDRAAALARADRTVGTVLSKVPENATILLVGVADVREPGLRVAITVRRGEGSGEQSGKESGEQGGTEGGKGSDEQGGKGSDEQGGKGSDEQGGKENDKESGRAATYLTASSTRRPGLVTLTDVTPTVLRLAGMPMPGQLTGSPWQAGSVRPARQAEAIRALQDRDLAARITRALVAPFNVALVAGQLVVYGLAALLWQRRRGARRTVLAVTRYVALAAAAAPAATYLANLVPWWSVAHPSGGLIAAVLAADFAVLALAVTGPWRRHPLGPGTVVAAVTALALAADAIAGSHLQADSLNGNFSLVAGRFYGFGNLTFALFAAASLICAAGLAGRALATGHRRRALLTVLLIGAAAIVVDGWPGWGSDFGGVLALTPGVALLAIGIAGRRVSPRWMLAAGAVGALLVAGIAYLDYRRPAGHRTHLGDFYQRLLDGQAAVIIVRKADSMLHSLGSVWLTLLVPVPLLILTFILLRADGRLVRHFQRAPALRTGLLAVLVTAIIGFAVNDSGIAVLALTALFAVPLAVAAALAGPCPVVSGVGTGGEPGCGRV